ncbi:MAG TPA: phosphonate C-P lyase system protein PhnL [Xanthobacteraceae bacterium]|jgi:alpha-D-ribose 1-methylphosphonate 5-triphosphate synthase subunit PhnL
MTVVLDVTDVSKSFTMHLRGGMTLPVVRGVSFVVRAGECVVLSGPSGAGKSSILKMIFGSYRCDQGAIRVHHDVGSTDIATASPREVIALRRRVIAYVSQFLRAVPRVAAIDVVAEPLLACAVARELASQRAGDLLTRLNVPERLRSLPPATFSGGEQQRVNIARGLVGDHPLLLLDEPTASLDEANRAIVMDLINARKRRGTAVVAIVHDADVRNAIADRVVDVSSFAAAA